MVEQKPSVVVSEEGDVGDDQLVEEAVELRVPIFLLQ